MGGELSIEDAGVPRTIWFLWFQGIGNAPEVVRRCHESWLARNPGWEVRTLDDASLPTATSLDYTSGRLATQTPNHRSNVVRLELLARHGGVWADATCLCMQPLDEWLPANLGSGFFAFRRPKGDRLLSSWFLAARPGNHLVVRWLERMGEYWGGAHVPGQGPAAGGPGPAPDRLGREAGALVLAPRPGRPPHRAVLRRPLRLRAARPHGRGGGAHLGCNSDRQCRPTARPLRRNLLEPPSPSLRAEIDRRVVPLYKLTWKLGERPIPPEKSALGYLLSTVES